MTKTVVAKHVENNQIESLSLEDGSTESIDIVISNIRNGERYSLVDANNNTDVIVVDDHGELFAITNGTVLDDLDTLPLI